MFPFATSKSKRYGDLNEILAALWGSEKSRTWRRSFENVDLIQPEDKPSWDLLKMQWYLLRVAAICGAADVTDDYHDDIDPEVLLERAKCTSDTLDQT
ncbi:hypothetical protein VTI28DRAFT_4666 [Corynascus sepedonium]